MRPRLRPLPAVLCASLAFGAAADPVEFTPGGDFSEDAIRRGVKATREQCEAVKNALWVSTPGHGEACLKYWAEGFRGAPAPRAIVYFHGDVWVGAAKTNPAYLNTNKDRIERDAFAWSQKLDAPYVFFARPGTYGSSGNHMQRRRAAESVLVSHALDQLKERLKIGEFILAGQSGGGHLTASLLTLRGDIVCAVPASAPSSPRVRWLARGLRKDTTGFSDSYEPAAHLDKDRVHPALRVFVLGDPLDANVVWPSQTHLATKLKEAGIAVETLEGVGAGPVRHGLPNSARIVAGWCLKDLPTEEIVRRAAAGLRG